MRHQSVKQNHQNKTTQVTHLTQSPIKLINSRMNQDLKTTMMTITQHQKSKIWALNLNLTLNLNLNREGQTDDEQNKTTQNRKDGIVKCSK